MYLLYINTLRPFFVTAKAPRDQAGKMCVWYENLSCEPGFVIKVYLSVDIFDISHNF